MIAIPLYFQLTAKASNTVAGAHLFPAVAGNAIGGIISGIVIKRCAFLSIIHLPTHLADTYFLIAMDDTKALPLLHYSSPRSVISSSFFAGTATPTGLRRYILCLVDLAWAFLHLRYLLVSKLRSTLHFPQSLHHPCTSPVLLACVLAWRPRALFCKAR